MSPFLMNDGNARPGATAALLISMGLVALFLMGCAANVPSEGELPHVVAGGSEVDELTSDGLQMVSSRPRSKLWVRPDHHIGRYDNIMIASISFAYEQGQTELDKGQENRVAEMLVKAIGGITENSPVGKVSDPGPCVVAVQLGLKDIRLHLGEAADSSSSSYVSSFGSATMIVEFRDSLTDTTLLRYAANRGLGGGQGTGRDGADMGRLGRALGKMVTDMTTDLQTIVPDTTSRPATECNNGIYKLTGRS